MIIGIDEENYVSEIIFYGPGYGNNAMNSYVLTTINDSNDNEIKFKKVMKTGEMFFHYDKVIDSGQVQYTGLDNSGKIWQWNYSMNGRWVGSDYNGDFQYSSSKSNPKTINGLEDTIITDFINGFAIDIDQKLWKTSSNAICINDIENSRIKNSRIKKVINLKDSNSCLALDTENRLWAYGNNVLNLRKDEMNEDYSNPICLNEKTEDNILDGKGIIDIAEASETVLAINEDGELVTWGKNNYGLLGTGKDYSSVNEYELEPNIITLTEKLQSIISCTQYKVEAVDINGCTWMWGQRKSIQEIYDVGDTISIKPIKITPSIKSYFDIPNFVKVEAAGSMSTALDSEGRIWAWGRGSLGANKEQSYSTSEPILVGGYYNEISHEKIVDISENVALDKNGKVWMWGNVPGLNITTKEPICLTNQGDHILRDKTINKISGYTLIDNEGKLYILRYNKSKRLDNEYEEFSEIDFVDVKEVADGGFIALDSEGRVWLSHSYDDKPEQINFNGIKIKSVTGSKYSNDGSIHYLVIDEEGDLWVWGSNSRGQLGLPSRMIMYQPVCLSNIEEMNGTKNLLYGKKFVKALASDRMSLVIDETGKIYTFGYNWAGQLGQNVEDLLELEIKCINKDNGLEVKDISLGYNYCLALDKKGNIWSWGDDSYGATGRYGMFTIVPLKTNGTTYKYSIVEQKAYENISDAIEVTQSLKYANNSGDYNKDNIKQHVECSLGYTDYAYMDLDNNGNLWSYGRNNSTGILGDGTTNSWQDPKCINYMFRNKKIDEILSYSATNGIVKDIDGDIWIWGDNTYGQCGTGDTNKKLTPICINQEIGISIENIINAGETNIVQDIEGQIWSWGRNNFGQCGTGTTDSVLIPTNISWNNEIRIEHVISSGMTNIVQDTEGKIWSWGQNVYGQCGTGTTDNVLEPTCINLSGEFTIEKTIESSPTVIVQDAEGKIWTWGYNNEGECGTGTTDNVLNPTCINESNKFTVKQILKSGLYMEYGSGNFYPMGITGTIIVEDTEGGIWTWGDNKFGQCGTGTTDNVLEPTCINESNKFIIQKVILSEAAIILQDTEEKIWSWGRNNLGQCGTGTTDNVLEPTCINPENPFTIEKIIYNELNSTNSSISKSIIVQDTEGRIWSWGENKYGECGTGTTESVLEPTCINPENPFVIEKIIYNKLDVPYSYNGKSIIVQDTEGRIWSWGQNSYGECGTGNAQVVLSPTCISNNTPMNLKDCNISVTYNGVFVINKDNEAWIWNSETKPTKINEISNINGQGIKELAITNMGIIALNTEGKLYLISDDLSTANNYVGTMIIGTYGTGNWKKDFVLLHDSKY